MQPERGVLLKTLGRHMSRQRYQRGTLKKVGKTRKMWLGRFRVYVRQPDGTETRRDRLKILGLATMSKSEAQKLLDELISRSTGQPSPSGLPADATFAELWTRYVELKKATWATSAQKTLRAIFSGTSKYKKHPNILFMIGDRRVSELTHGPLQAILNRVAERGESLSTLKTVRTYLAASLEYAVAERLIPVNPARNLELPTKLLKKKPCERFYTVAEVHRLMSVAAGREHLALALLFACGLRPQELLALRDDDVQPGALRIDEAIKEKERGEKRIGETKSSKSNGYVYLPAAIYREIQNWIMIRPTTVSFPTPDLVGSPFLFPTERGTPFRIGNFLKRNLKPIARLAGILDFTLQATRRTCGTHFQRHGNPKDAQAHLRHSELAMTGLYVKEIPEQIRDAVESLYAELCGETGAIN
jgi:integrase